MDTLAPSFAEPVIMQIGASSYTPRNARYVRFARSDEMEAWIREARLVVTHCGVGSIITALKHGVPIVVVPRLKRFAEVVDDHQLEVARVLSESGKVTVGYQVESLPQAIAQATAPPAIDDHQRELIDALSRYMREFAEQQGEGAARP